MRKRFYVIPILLLVVFALLIAAITYFGFMNVLVDSSRQTGIIVPDKEPVYHFAMICQNIDDPFWLSIKKGVELASREFNVAVEFNGPTSSNAEEELKYLNIAIASRVDGIACHVPDEVKAGELINKAAKRNIPVVTVQTDAKDSKRASFVGANMYDFGIRLGRMLTGVSNGTSNAVVLTNNSEKSGSTIQNLIISGIKDAVKEYPKIKIQAEQIEGDEFLSSEDKVKEILERQPENSTIICTTEGDTLGVAQLLVDLNKVGYNIIGYGESASVLRYISNGVIYGTVTGNPEKIGYDAIKALVDIRRTGHTSDYYPVELQMITRGNVHKYLAEDKK